MKALLHKTLLILLACVLGGAAFGQDGFYFTGRVLDVADSTPVAQVNISILGSHLGTTTDNSGIFSLWVEDTDTLQVTAVQYKAMIVAVASYAQPADADLYLTPELYQLNEVTIESFDKDKFRNDFLNLKLAPNPYQVNLNIPQDLSYLELEKDIEAPMLGNYGGGAGFIFYPNWDFRAKQLKWQREQVDLWVEREALQKKIEARYNPQIVALYVDLTEEQLEAFMKFCDLNPEFIVEATDYEIAEVIRGCYLAYNK